MKEFTGERSIVIKAPIGAVYEYVSDFPHHVEWNYQLVKLAKLTDGKVVVGSRFRANEKAARSQPWFIRLLWPLLSILFGSTGYTEAEITTLEPDKRVAWKAAAPLKNGNYMAKAEWELRLEPKGDSTQVTQGFQYHFFGKMSEGMDVVKAARDTGDEVSTNLAILKGMLERQASFADAPNRTALA